MNKDYSTIGKWEKGDRTPTINDTIDVAKYFDISLNDLVTKNLQFENKEKITTNKFIKEVNDLLSQTDMEDKQKNMIKAILENIKED